jgi:hypothetical protein
MSYLEQDGDPRYFDIRLTLGEAIAIVMAVDDCVQYMGQLDINEKDQFHPELRHAYEKIFSKYQKTIKFKSNKYA